MTDNETDLDYSQREAITKDIDKKLTTDWVEGLKLLRSYDNHESEDLKRDILAMVWRFALRSNDSTVRQELVNYLLDVVAHETLFLQGQAIKFLQDFSPSDFDKRATERLESWSWAEEYGSEIIRLIGIAEIHSKTLDLQKVAGTEWEDIDPFSFYASRQWAASLVLARFGNLESTERVIKRVKDEPDIILRSTKLFEDLVYTKQPLAFDTLRFYLHSNERLPQVKNTVPGRLEAIYAAELFAKHVYGCPVTNPDITEKDIVTIRRWADEQVVWQIH